MSLLLRHEKWQVWQRTPKTELRQIQIIFQVPEQKKVSNWLLVIGKEKKSRRICTCNLFVETPLITASFFFEHFPFKAPDGCVLLAGQWAIVGCPSYGCWQRMVQLSPGARLGGQSATKRQTSSPKLGLGGFLNHQGSQTPQVLPGSWCLGMDGQLGNMGSLSASYLLWTLVTWPSDTCDIPEFSSQKRITAWHDLACEDWGTIILDSKAEKQILTFLDHLDPRVALGIWWLFVALFVPRPHLKHGTMGLQPSKCSSAPHLPVSWMVFQVSSQLVSLTKIGGFKMLWSDVCTSTSWQQSMTWKIIPTWLWLKTRVPKGPQKWSCLILVDSFGLFRKNQPHMRAPHEAP